MRNYSIHDLKWKNKGHELDLLAEKILNKKMKYILIGSQNEKDEFKSRTNYELSILREIELPEITGIKKDENIGIVCLYKNRKMYNDCRIKCEQLGFKENNCFFQGEVFQIVYDAYKHDQIKIDRIEVFMTSLCTLNCEKCISYIPYFKNKIIMPLNKLKHDMDLLFSKVDYVFKLKLLGGEGFLYPDLIAYIDYIYDNYHNQIGSIRIGTNGTIEPTDEMIEMCKRDNVTVDISDYSEAVPNLSKLELVKSKLLENGVTVDVKRTGEQWLDMGFPERVGDNKNEEMVREHFKKCAMFCRQFSDGKLFFCCSNCAAVKAGLYELNENDYFDFEKEFNKKELLEYELGFSNLGHTSFCNVCQGGSDEANPWHVEVAKQAERGAKNI